MSVRGLSRWLVAVGLSAVALGCQRADERKPAHKGMEEQTARPAATVVAPLVPTTAPAAPAAATATDSGAKSASSKPKSEGLQVRRLVLAQGVQNREPVEAATSFEVGRERVYAFVEVENRAQLATAVFVSFVSPKGVSHGPIELDVGAAPRWRTWAFTRAATQPGTWKVVVADSSGKTLASADFEVAEPSPYEERRPGA